MMVIILSLHTVHLSEIQDLLTLQRAVLLINLNSPGRFGLVPQVAAFHSLSKAGTEFLHKSSHAPTSDSILEIKGETKILQCTGYPHQFSVNVYGRNTCVECF